ncbi:PREDICTED: uncharacterized protein LOC106111201 [Papilio polytes]|uniref:uncharacterized protein LOC106111201 n=1 Tax=Papilio polytes TaxID=76194 RepID=UPI000675F707|nr:PREDICTED: uncharacterized protein LOC106111201 [Papilio polytes]
MALKIPINQLLILSVVLINTAFGEDATKSPANPDEKGNCTCGGFSTATITAESAPLLAQSPGLMVKCNEEGETACKNLCVALANVTKAKGPEILCKRLKDADELKLSAFFKVCDNPWIYADMTADEPLCCENEKIKTCASAPKDNTTAVVDAKTVM